MDKYDIDESGYASPHENGDWYKVEDVENVLEVSAKKLVKVNICPYCMSGECVKNLSEEAIHECELDGVKCFVEYIKGF